MIVSSLRWRLQAWYALILILVLAGFGVTAYHVTREDRMRAIDAELSTRLIALVRPEPPDREPPGPFHGHEGPAFMPPDGPGLGPGPRPGGGPNDAEFHLQIRDAILANETADGDQTNEFYSVLWQSDGTLSAQSSNAPPAVTNPFQPAPDTPQVLEYRSPAAGPRFRFRTRDGFREVYELLPRGDCILVGQSLASEHRALERLSVWLLLAGCGVLLLGLAGGWLVSTRCLRPVKDISRVAVKIAGGNLCERIPVSETRSELGQLAADLNSSFARLEALFAQQARFTADASHELRTPLSVILTQTQSALSRERSAAEYRETVEACLRAAQRMRQLTASLLQLARLDAGEEPLKHEWFDISHVVREGVEMLRPLAREKGVELRCETAPAECHGDAGYIGQVTANLLTNAIQFSKQQGEVRVATRRENGFAVLSVSDSGEGIALEHLPHIFDRFYRADKSRSRTQGSTGLGLAICKAIVDAHHGSIQVASQPGEGSTFEVRLPGRPGPDHAKNAFTAAATC